MGPTLGGWLTDHYSWRWAFYINIPVGVVALIMISRFIKDPPYITHGKAGRLDYIGFGLLAIWLGILQIILDRGQEDDWFGAMWIRWAFVILILSFVSFVVWQLKERRTAGRPDHLQESKLHHRLPADLPVWRRHLRCGHHSAALLPDDDGLFGNVGRHCGVASRTGFNRRHAAGWFSRQQTRTRWLVSLGFGVFGICSLVWSTITLQISPWSMLVPIIISGFSLGLVFVPLSTTTLGDFARPQHRNGSGLFNLLRNVGGSVGISIVTTLLARRQQLHRTELSQHLSPTLPTVQQALDSFTRLLSPDYGPADAHTKAYGMLQNVLAQQASLWAYVDIFRYMAMACFCCVPVVWAIKRVRRKAIAAH